MALFRCLAAGAARSWVARSTAPTPKATVAWLTYGVNIWISTRLAHTKEAFLLTSCISTSSPIADSAPGHSALDTPAVCTTLLVPLSRVPLAWLMELFAALPRAILMPIARREAPSALSPPSPRWRKSTPDASQLSNTFPNLSGHCGPSVPRGH